MAIAAATRITYDADQPQCLPLFLPLWPADAVSAGRVAWLVARRPGAVRLARDAVTGLVTRFCPWMPVEDARTVVSESVTNAIRHGAPPCVLYVEHTRGRLLMAVYDGGPGFLVLRRLTAHARRGRLYSPARTGGRGLGLISDLAHSWAVAGMAGGTVVSACWRAGHTHPALSGLNEPAPT